MRVWKVLATASLALSMACATPKPVMQAGSTSVLRLLRDWRGTWTGKIDDSPMGPMTYTLYVEDVGGTGLLRVRMARPRDPTLDTVKQTYEFLEFKDGSPKIRFAVSQRNSTQDGRLTYREERSSDSEAVFCLEGRGCDKLMLIFTQLGPQELRMRTLVDEARHTDAVLAYTSPEVPAEEAAPEPELIREPVPTPKKAKQEKKKGGGDSPIDRDEILKEHYDKDITTEHLDEDIKAP